MAHQAHNIPWSLLASNLRWVSAGSSCCGAADLHPRLKPKQGKDFTHFVEAFIRNIEEHSASERRKYPEEYDAPSPADEILDEGLVKKIGVTVRRWFNYGKKTYKWDEMCNHYGFE